MNARRRSASAAGAIVAAAALAAATLAGSAAAGTSSSAAMPRTHREARTPAPAACPSRAVATPPAQRWPAARRALAPAGASAIRLCRYSGLNARPRLALIHTRLLGRASLVRRLVTDFDRLPPPTGAVACPNDDGSQILARLVYPGGHSVMIAVGLSGCRLVTNGSVIRTAEGMGIPRAYGPQLIARLEHLVDAGAAPPRRPAAGGAAAYDPARRRWRRLASVPAALASAYAASVWTGRQAFVFGQAAASVAGLYDPLTNRWTTTTAPVGPLNQPTAIWTGHQIVVAGLAAPNDNRLEAAAYDPATHTWTPLNPPVNPNHRPMGLAMVATHDGVLLWSLWARTNWTGAHTGQGFSGVDVFRLGPALRWRNVTGTWPQGHTVDQPTFTGRTILLAPGQIWCGPCSHPAPIGEHGYTADPRTLRRSPIPAGPFDDLGPQILWTGAAEISLNVGGTMTGPHVRVLPGAIAFWNPVTRRWASGPRAPRPPSDAPAVWTNAGLLVLARDGRLLRYAG